MHWGSILPIRPAVRNVPFLRIPAEDRSRCRLPSFRGLRRIDLVGRHPYGPFRAKAPCCDSGEMMKATISAFSSKTGSSLRATPTPPHAKRCSRDGPPGPAFTRSPTLRYLATPEGARDRSYSRCRLPSRSRRPSGASRAAPSVRERGVPTKGFRPFYCMAARTAEATRREVRQLRHSFLEARDTPQDRSC